MSGEWWMVNAKSLLHTTCKLVAVDCGLWICGLWIVDAWGGGGESIISRMRLDLRLECTSKVAAHTLES